MKSIEVYHYDAFSKEPNKGNPAGVVLDGDDLTDTEMQEIAFKVGFNETAFSIRSDVADLRIRFFTPGHEMNLCGHGTMATIYALITKGLLGNKTELTIETKAGILPINIHTSTANEIQIEMRQAPPQFEAFNGSKKDLANSIGLEASDIDDSLPILYGSTGTWTLLIPIKKLESFKKMRPNNQQFPSILKEMPKTSLHPFCLQTYDPTADMHARHFSSPYSGTVEDAVTGTASGVMGSYFASYIKKDLFDGTMSLVVEQGQEIGKDGRVMVHISKSDEIYKVGISGNAVFVTKFDVLLEGE
ncbi:MULTISPECIES: PhzF family phenazine biosynthesis protein [unclassified Sporosarcina]|uniref:PhzF family phenazine biosynthesis protein n=1 Tax=unclassified Sporosarcina TaxID=2647733 RepID=UPI00203F3B68|nr:MULTISPECIES: PhzF family phenazine biosynthesis protein [unclassified Sporosarcina]GKV64410.1 isomerase [Sporosarcina sp. NCCP-2331]GLB55155.1 isomerase [Sporosarcina sp. NCCP-2378]